jgi:serine/threonine-protein kinase
MIELDRFTIIEKIGEGSMGEVYKAYQISMDRTVAVKVLDPELAEDEVFAERFLHEARSIGKLNHPNVVQGIDFGQSGGHLFFAMEYVEGPSLYEILNQGPLEEDEVLEIGLQVARALEHGHGQGIIHRDIKPGNIMISAEGIAKVTDYGLAKRNEGSSKKSTAAGRVMGTPYYISPEQARGENDIDIRSDVYSLGATLYHAATGKPPFPGKNAPDIMSKAINEPFPDPRKENPELTAAFAKLTMKMAQKDKTKRPENPAALIREIERAMRASAAERQRQSIGANLNRTLRRVVARADESQRGIPPRIKLAIAGAVAAAVVVILLAIVLPGFEKKEQPSHPAKPGQTKVAKASEREPRKRERVQPKESYVKEQVRKAEEELTQEAREAYLKAERFARGTDDIEEAIVRLHQVAASYAGPFGDKAKKLASELQGKWEAKGAEELKRCKAQAAEALASMNYGAAIEAYEGFSESLANTAAGEQAYELRKEILEQARSSFIRLRDKAEKFAGEGKYDEAVDLYKKVLAFGVKEIVGQANARIAKLEKEKAALLVRQEQERKRRAKKLFESFYPEYAALIDRKDFKGAQQLCSTVLADQARKEIHDIIRKHLADAEMVLKVHKAGREAALHLKLQQYTFELEGGRTVKGLVKNISGDVLDVELADMKGAILGIEISRLTGTAFVKLAFKVLADTPDNHLACGVFLLLSKGDGVAARKEFALAAAGGLDISRYNDRVAALEKQQEEQEAGKLYEEFKKAVKRKKWKEVADAAEKLTKKYDKTKVVEDSRAEIEKAYTYAVLRLAQKEKIKTTKKDKDKMAPGLVGTYYNGRNFGEQRLRRIDATIDFSWADRSPHPDVRRNNFSVRWEGFIAIPRSGRYTFIVNSDDGARMWIAGQELFNDWRDRAAADSSKEITLKKDYYPVKIEYYDAGGHASVRLLWSIGGQRQVIPAKYLFHSKK